MFSTQQRNYFASKTYYSVEKMRKLLITTHHYIISYTGLWQGTRSHVPCQNFTYPEPTLPKICITNLSYFKAFLIQPSERDHLRGIVVIITNY